MAVWNQATGTGLQLAVEGYVVPSVGYYYYRTYPQFSQDGGMMLMRSGKFVYIWDLNNPLGDSPHLPNYVHELRDASDAHFVDNSTIQTCHQITRRNLRYPLVNITTYYDFDAITGAQIGETEETSYDYLWPYSYDDWRFNPCLQ